MKKISFLFLIIFVLIFSALFAQPAPFNVLLIPYTVPGFTGLQSFAFGKFNNKWLLVGGRLDGLHRRQPFAAFDVAGQPLNIFVIDPSLGQIWTTSLSTLPVNIQEQLSSTNMEFYQQDSILYCIGGYGYSNIAGDHITYDGLTAINVPLVIDAIINGGSITGYFRQITDQQFAVTGGRLEKIYDTFYLVGGQKFTGRYNPMNMPTFTQEYTNQVRRFIMNDNGTTISITHLQPLTDTTNLHRRDYNLIPQVMTNGEEGLTVFSGVFQKVFDVPYLNCVDIDSSGYVVNNAFSQYYNHYDCAFLPLYSASENEMHNLFFGGIAQYYDSLNILVQDNNVPFVKTIARVTREGSGLMTEYKLPVEMPSFLGAGSAFIAVDGLPMYPNHVIKLDDITTDTTLVGYIVGGISSTASNIFFTNTGSQSVASDQLFKVFLIKNASVGIHQVNEQSQNGMHLQVYPNPSSGNLYINFYLEKKSDVKLTITDINGKVLLFKEYKSINPGENVIKYNLLKSANKQVYNVFIETTTMKSSQKIIIN